MSKKAILHMRLTDLEDKMLDYLTEKYEMTKTELVAKLILFAYIKEGAADDNNVPCK